MKGPTCYLNGKFLPLAQANISVLDRGFLFGEGIYEVIPVFSGLLFRLEKHLQRLQQSLSAIELSSPLTNNALTQVLQELMHRNHSIGSNMSLYLQITRGAPSQRNHVYQNDSITTVFAMAQSLTQPNITEGVKAITLADTRWSLSCIKSTSLLANVILKQQASKQGAAEALLIREGCLTEGAASNVFVVKNQVISTPPKSNFLLGGITRDVLIELLQRQEYPACLEQTVTEQALQEADEIWITSSTKEILPITVLNKKPIGDGQPGPIWHQTNELYQNYKQATITRGSHDTR